MFSVKLLLLVLPLICISQRGECEPQNSTDLELKTTSKFLRENCRCSSQWQCECCARVNNDLLNVHQKFCADFIVFSKSWDIRANVRLNDNVLYTNTFSAWSIPPFCVPLWPALALTGCLQLHTIGQHEFNTLHGCGNVTINFISFNLVNWQIGCIDIGTGGIQIVEPNHDVVNSDASEKPPEIELETTDSVKSKNFNKVYDVVNSDANENESEIELETSDSIKYKSLQSQINKT